MTTRQPAIITLLTDFGTADGYVGEVKGVLLSRAPHATLVDITHDIPPQDVERARLALARVWRRFPEGTIHLAVVDPGVGSSRAAIAIESAGRYLVGPDNGLLTPALSSTDARVVQLAIPKGASATFHGRDVFAPAAAALANGATLDELGVEAAAPPMMRRTPEPMRLDNGSLSGEVILIDRFGNAITNLIGLHGGTVDVGSRSISVRHTYAEGAPGEPVAVVGSTGFIEIAVRNGDAARTLGVSPGTRVVLRTSR